MYLFSLNIGGEIICLRKNLEKWFRWNNKIKLLNFNCDKYYIIKHTNIFNY